MSNELCFRIRDRFYAVDERHRTFHRVQPLHENDRSPETYAPLARMLLRGRYRRPNLSADQNAAAHAHAIIDGDTLAGSGDINVALTAIRIMKELEFLEAVAAEDEAKIVEIEQEEHGVTKLAAKLGGHQIGSTIVVAA